jgi:molybdate transport system substrate-binding protein
MKKLTVIVLGLILPMMVFAAGKNDKQASAAEAPATEITVYAASSMTAAMNEIAGLYKQSNPNVNIVYNFDSSGTLKTQIQNGAPADIFISAAQGSMDQLDIAALPTVNVDKLDFVLTSSRFNIVTNQVVLIVPVNSTKGISDFKDVTTTKVTLVALGNSDVPAGQYAQEIYTSLGLWDTIVKSGKVTYGSNVKEVVTHVESGAVDCGVCYVTDITPNVKIAAAAPAGTYKPVTYPAAILKGVKDQKATEAFMAYLKGPQARAVFERIGFGIPQ